MKASRSPSAPLLIGFVLAGPLERYYYLTVNLYPRPADWLTRPAVIIIGLLLIAPFVWGVARALRQRAGQPGAVAAQAPRGSGTAFSVVLFALFAYAWWTARAFLPGAALMPLTVAVGGTILCVVRIVQEARGRGGRVADDGEDEAPSAETVRRGGGSRGGTLQQGDRDPAPGRGAPSVGAIDRGGTMVSVRGAGR